MPKTNQGIAKAKHTVKSQRRRRKPKRQKDSALENAASKIQAEKTRRQLEAEEVRKKSEQDRIERQQRRAMKRRSDAKLLRRTKRGQPVMAHQIEHLLDKIRE